MVDATTGESVIEMGLQFTPSEARRILQSFQDFAAVLTAAAERGAERESVFMTVAEFASLLGVDKTTIHRWEKEDKQGEMPQKYQVGKRAVGYLRTDVAEYIKTRPPAVGHGPRTKGRS